MHGAQSPPAPFLPMTRQIEASTEAHKARRDFHRAFHRIIDRSPMAATQGKTNRLALKGSWNAAERNGRFRPFYRFSLNYLYLVGLI